MKQPILVLLLLVLAFLSGYELHRRHRPVDQTADPTYISGSRQKAGSTSNLVANEDKGSKQQSQIRQQEIKVADLDKRLQAKAAAMAELNQRLSAMDQTADPEAPSHSLDDQVRQVQATIQNLLKQKQQQKEQAGEQAVSDQIQVQTRKLDQAQVAQRLRDQLQKEMAVSTALERQVQELTFIDDDLSALETLKPKAQAQQDRVHRLQAQYQGFLRQAILQDAEEHVRLQQQRSSPNTEAQIEKNIQLEQLQLLKLQQEDQAAYQKQAAGQVATDTLSESYQIIRSDYANLLHQRDEARRKLTTLKGSG